VKQPNQHITVFEHDKIRYDFGEKRITVDQFNALKNYYGANGVPYFDLCYNGVKFKEYVGVIQIGTTTIEVLPKADKYHDDETWKKILIGMIRAVGSFEIKVTSDSNLTLRPNTILDLYFELFIQEIEYLIHSGLLKQYRKIDNNSFALKGNLQFSQHIQQNLTHQERFYVRRTTYDVKHKLHMIIYKTILLIKRINTNTNLLSRIGSLLLSFPEMPDIKINEVTFEKLVFNRKTQSYKKAIDIAKLILLHYHPDISRGRNHVLAIMFDMNTLWEQFVLVSLRRYLKGCVSIQDQTSKYFWKPESGQRSSIKPDILIKLDNEKRIVLDTKWKNLNGYNPSPDDLRQMYVYHEYFKAEKVALIYPNAMNKQIKGDFLEPTSGTPFDKQCCVISLSVDKEIINWQKNISETIKNWIETKVVV
jgi:5-methylcytosine-specific restriction enzyme subunit McrC